MLCIVFPVVFLSSCEKTGSDNEYNIEIPDTFNIISVENPEDAIARIRFLQGQPSHTWGLSWMIPNLISGEYMDFQPEFNSFSTFNYASDPQYSNNFWTDFYESIHLCNLFLKETKSLNGAEINYFKGVAHFYRSYAYYTLVRNFGKFYPDENLNAPGVPIIGAEISNLSRASVSEVYSYIIEDMDSAASLLPEPIPEKINRYAAIAIAAKTHIWFKKYDLAEPLLNEIIQSNRFALLPNFEDNFNGSEEDGPESIYELQFYIDGDTWYSPGYKPRSWYTSYISNEPRRFYVSDETVSNFDTDKRGNKTFYSLGDTMYSGSTIIMNTDGIHYIKKYAHINGIDFGWGVNSVLIRLADIYLLYSEVKISQSELTEALQYINMVRTRAGNSPLTLNGMTSEQLFEVLQNERFKELCGEGEFWYDIIRWDIAELIVGSRGFIHGVNEVYPIPQSVIEYNSGITQNPGY